MLSITNRSGSALIVSIILMNILVLMMVFLVERIIPSSRAVSGIENTTIAAYHASSAVEQALATFNINNPGHSLAPAGDENATWTGGTAMSSEKYAITETGKSIPLPGTGNSEYDSDWNRIQEGKPIQLFITEWFINSTNFLAGVQLDLRMPQLGSLDATAGSSAATRYFTGSSSFSVVNFTISNSGTLVTASYQGTSCGGQDKGFTADLINDPISKNLGEFCVTEIGKPGSMKLSAYLNQPSTANLCTGGCTLKFAILQNLKNENGQPVPYLEYRLRRAGSVTPSNKVDCFLTYQSPSMSSCDLSMPSSITLQFSQIQAEGVEYGFRKTANRSVRQLTTSEWVDFTVFQ